MGKSERHSRHWQRISTFQPFLSKERKETFRLQNQNAWDGRNNGYFEPKNPQKDENLSNGNIILCDVDPESDYVCTNRNERTIPFAKQTVELTSSAWSYSMSRIG